jgi:hypothetical protein
MKPSRRTRWAGAAVALLVAVVIGAVLIGSGGSNHRRPTSTPGAGAGPGATPAPGPGPPAKPAPARQQFGANVNRLFNDRTYTASEIAAQLRALSATGATLARSDALWEATEPSAPVDEHHRYNWGFDDSIAASLAAQGLRWLPILDYTAPWDASRAGVAHSPPRSPAAFAAFAGAFALRYGPGGAFWRSHPELAADPVDTYEIWNEPDNGVFWAPTPDPAAYAELYLVSRDAIASADPGARVIIGGLTKPPVFLPELVHAQPDLVGHIDGVALHPYGDSAAAVLGKIRTARATLASLGLGSVPLYVTELGWTTHPAGTINYAPARRRPRDIFTTLTALGHTNCGIAATLIYTWVTPELNPADKEDWFGIHPPSGGASADTAAFAAGLRGATSPGPTLHVCR